MRYTMYPSGIYRVLEVSGNLIISQLEELRILISGYISQGESYIAVRFTDASYLYSGAIAVLISCFKLVRDIQGDLCLLEPKKEMIELLKQMGIDSLISIYVAEENLPGHPGQIEGAKIRYPG